MSSSLIKLTDRRLFLMECKSISHLSSLFPSISSLFENKQGIHLFHQSSRLIDFIMAKVPKFTPSAPVFFVDSHKTVYQDVEKLLSPYSTLTDLTEDFDIIACASSSHDFYEGQRTFLEEQGRMLFDEETQKSLTGYVSFIDPRNRNMGTRIIAVEGCVEGESFKSEDYYKMWRILNGVCEGEYSAKSKAESMNFQYFNGVKGKESDVFMLCGILETNNVGEDPVDLGYKKNIKNLRVVDSKGEVFGVVFESYCNLCLIKMTMMPSEAVLLESGEKINVWKPSYMI